MFEAPGRPEGRLGASNIFQTLSEPSIETGVMATDVSLHRHMITSPRWDPGCCCFALGPHGEEPSRCAAIAGILE